MHSNLILHIYIYVIVHFSEAWIFTLSNTKFDLKSSITTKRMKFGKRLRAEATELQINEESRAALIRYKILKRHIRNMDLPTSRSRNLQAVEGECCICFEPFQFASQQILTACQHAFHPGCLVHALGTGSCTSCPLCRRTAAGLVPSGVDGDCIRFLAMIRVNANAVQVLSSLRLNKITPSAGNSEHRLFLFT